MKTGKNGKIKGPETLSQYGNILEPCVPPHENFLNIKIEGPDTPLYHIHHLHSLPNILEIG
jgi:hypothetical protein